MKRRTSRNLAHCCENPLTTFTTEQAIYLTVGGIVAASVFGYLLYNAGKSTQQIADLQAYQAGTFGQATTTAGG
jgi:hypothetical protein